MRLDLVTAGGQAPEIFNVIIEIPMAADPVKYEVDKETGALFVDRFMGTSMHYPCNYGYVPCTLSPDGDLYVADGYGNARVHKYSPNGKLQFSWGEPGTDPGAFNIVHNICCDEDGWIYVADTAALPYGEKTERQIATRVPALLGRLVERYRPRLVTIACNTASTIALAAAREALELPIVGTVPAIKPAAAMTKTGVIGLLGTAATIRQVYVDNLEAEFASDNGAVRERAARFHHEPTSVHKERHPRRVRGGADENVARIRGRSGRVGEHQGRPFRDAGG